jgi:hypothetical protein
MVVPSPAIFIRMKVAALVAWATGIARCWQQTQVPMATLMLFLLTPPQVQLVLVAVS